MQAGIGGILTALEHRHAQYVIGAIVFSSRAPAPPDRDPMWMRWGTTLALHGDLPPDAWNQWMLGGREEGIPAWISYDSLRDETGARIMNEARRRSDAYHTAHLVLEERSFAREMGAIGRGRIGKTIMRRCVDDFKEAEAARWPQIRGDVLAKCATGVLSEFRSDTRCDACGATGIMPYVLDDRRRQIKCPQCYGTGVTRLSDRGRADLIGMPWSTYRRAWKAPYDWLYQEALTARRQAVRHLREQLDE